MRCLFLLLGEINRNTLPVVAPPMQHVKIIIDHVNEGIAEGVAEGQIGSAVVDLFTRLPIFLQRIDERLRIICHWNDRRDGPRLEESYARQKEPLQSFLVPQQKGACA